jgi:hypothetical protein
VDFKYKANIRNNSYIILFQLISPIITCLAYSDFASLIYNNYHAKLKA